jgi:hypothetical protein
MWNLKCTKLFFERSGKSLSRFLSKVTHYCTLLLPMRIIHTHKQSNVQSQNTEPNIWNFKALLDIQCLTSSLCTLLHAVGTFQYLQQRHCQMKSVRKVPHGTDRWKKAGDGSYFAERLDVCLSATPIVTTKARFVGNRLLHSVKGTLGSDGRS